MNEVRRTNEEYRKGLFALGDGVYSNKSGMPKSWIDKTPQQIVEDVSILLYALQHPTPDLVVMPISSYWALKNYTVLDALERYHVRRPSRFRRHLSKRWYQRNR